MLSDLFRPLLRMPKLPKLRDVLGRHKKDKAEGASATERTVPEITTDAAPPAQKPDLYSTEGSIGIKTVAEPTDASLEYIQNPRHLIISLLTKVSRQHRFCTWPYRQSRNDMDAQERSLLARKTGPRHHNRAYYDIWLRCRRCQDMGHGGRQ